MHQIRFRLGSSQCSPRPPIAGFKGVLRLREGRARVGEGTGRKKGRGKEGRGEKRDERGVSEQFLNGTSAQYRLCSATECI